MKTRNTLRPIAAIFVGIVVILSTAVNLGLVFAGPVVGKKTRARPEFRTVAPTNRTGDEQLAYLRVRLVPATRRELAGHFTRGQSPIPAVDKLYQRLTVKNMIPPAASVAM